MNYLLVATSIRELISTEAQIGQSDKEGTVRYPPLQFGFGFDVCDSSDQFTASKNNTDGGASVSDQLHQNGELSITNGFSKIEDAAPETKDNDDHILALLEKQLSEKLAVSEFSKTSPEFSGASCDNATSPPFDLRTAEDAFQTLGYNPAVSFDEESDLATFYGPSPCVVLQVTRLQL